MEGSSKRQCIDEENLRKAQDVLSQALFQRALVQIFMTFTVKRMPNPIYWLNTLSLTFHHEFDAWLLPLWSIAFRELFGAEEYARWTDERTGEMLQEKVALLNSFTPEERRGKTAFLWKRAVEYMYRQGVRAVKTDEEVFSACFLDLGTFAYLSRAGTELLVSDGRRFVVSESERVSRVTRNLVLLRRERECSLFDLETQQSTFVFKQKLFYDVCVSPDGRYIATCKNPGAIWMFDVEAKKLLKYDIAEEYSYVLFFNSDNDLFYMASESLMRFNMQTGRSTVEYTMNLDFYKGYNADGAVFYDELGLIFSTNKTVMPLTGVRGAVAVVRGNFILTFLPNNLYYKTKLMLQNVDSILDYIPGSKILCKTADKRLFIVSALESQLLSSKIY